MTTKDLIIQTLDRLPENLWREVLDFILFLLQKQSKLEVLESSENLEPIKKPQFIYDRDRLVGALVNAETFQQYLAWQQQQNEPADNLSDRLAELQQACKEENYTLEVSPRVDRPNAFLEILE
ncbi:MAG TPA: DUF2281 domain-containing protein [Oscillatoriales cyanobacterium M59_W2019_021]|nr:DUF2281 domain-containing protein [Oscillatoriales cyanobacterium M4454_W2019_049]HIK51983.1 DUF2281 domain-containing protein [Oscillatoriales cyanobacterium M59_W2019_021]